MLCVAAALFFSKQTLSEDGINMNLRRMGTVRDYSTWRACEDDPNVTLYSKRVDFDIRMPVGPTIMMQVMQGERESARVRERGGT